MSVTGSLPQCPVSVTVLEMPLTVMVLLALQATVLFSLMPETMTGWPAGSVADGDGPVLGACVLPVEGPAEGARPLGVAAEVISVGDGTVRSSWENWRADANQFPASVQGSKNGWPGEKWLDIRQTSILLPIMQARVQKCQQAGFDGVEWDNVDGYSNKTGFPLTANDQLVYDASLANLAHQYGLTVAMKNDVEQVPNLASYFDYAINEQCQQYNECGNYTTYFVNAGKTVFQVEYKLSLAKFCPQANAGNRNAITKTFDLFDTPWTPCR